MLTLVTSDVGIDRDRFSYQAYQHTDLVAYISSNDIVCSIISKSVYTSLVGRLGKRRTEIYYLVISKIVII
jgi:hypothetical protein